MADKNPRCFFRGRRAAILGQINFSSAILVHTVQRSSIVVSTVSVADEFDGCRRVEESSSANSWHSRDKGMSARSSKSYDAFQVAMLQVTSHRWLFGFLTPEECELARKRTPIAVILFSDKFGRQAYRVAIKFH